MVENHNINFMHRIVFLLILFTISNAVLALNPESNWSFTLYDGTKISKSEFQSYLDRCENGDSDAMYVVGMYYHFRGYGEEFQKKSAYYLIKAAQAGNIGAAYQLGFNHTLTIEDRFFWLEMAADKGSYKAMSELEQLCNSVKKDSKSSFDWAQKAALASPRSWDKYILAMKYFNGSGCEKNYEQAYKYLQKAMDSEDFNDTSGLNVKPEVYAALGRLYFDGNYLRQDFDQAFKLFSIAYELKSYDNWNSYYLGLCYELGYGTMPDYEKAYEIYSKINYFEKSKVRQAIMLYKGLGIKQDYNEAVKILTNLVENQWYIGEEGAQILSACYRFGRGVEQSDEQAEYWWNRTLELKNKLHKLEQGYRQ